MLICLGGDSRAARGCSILAELHTRLTISTSAKNQSSKVVLLATNHMTPHLNATLQKRDRLALWEIRLCLRDMKVTRCSEEIRLPEVQHTTARDRVGSSGLGASSS